jgi:hypothetical protein
VQHGLRGIALFQALPSAPSRSLPFSRYCSLHSPKQARAL